MTKFFTADCKQCQQCKPRCAYCEVRVKSGPEGNWTSWFATLCPDCRKKHRGRIMIRTKPDSTES